MLLYSYAYEQLQAVTPFIKDNSGTLSWQLEEKTVSVHTEQNQERGQTATATAGQKSEQAARQKGRSPSR